MPVARAVNIVSWSSSTRFCVLRISASGTATMCGDWRAIMSQPTVEIDSAADAIYVSVGSDTLRKQNVGAEHACQNMRKR